MEKNQKNLNGKNNIKKIKDNQKRKIDDNTLACPVSSKCGGCQLLEQPYLEQLEDKEKIVSKLLAPYGKLEQIKGMDFPYFYRNKVHAVFAQAKGGKIISGVYREGSHEVVQVDKCLIEDQQADAIIGTIEKLLPSFKIKPYNEDRGYGFLRHVLIRVGHNSKEIMVVLVTASSVFPSKNNFIKALRREHPQITTIVQNINNRNTSMVLGEQEKVLYGPGYIVDILCGKSFKISPKSFYQINSIQTELLYHTAMEFADFQGNEKVLDAYCGIGTIGIVASDYVQEVVGVELNVDAVSDAKGNARKNQVKNIHFYQGDAGKFMVKMAEKGEAVDVVLMDPPRAGSDEAFLKSTVRLNPKKIVYISCNPQTLARDLSFLTKHGYQMKRAMAFDMFPQCEAHVECVALLHRKKAGARSGKL